MITNQAIDAAFTRFPTLTTDRLTLRQLRPTVQATDADAFYAIKYHPSVTPAYGQEPHGSISDTLAWMDRHKTYYAQRQSLFWCITLKSDATDTPGDTPTDMPIGSCLFWNFDADYRTAEIGYELHPDYWRQGIIAEAVTAMIDYGFAELDLHRVEALLLAQNAASKGVLVKLGFTHEGTLRQREYFRGQYLDLLYYGLLRDEWGS